MVGDVSRVALQIDLSLPALQAPRGGRRCRAAGLGAASSNAWRDTACRRASGAPVAQRGTVGDADRRLSEAQLLEASANTMSIKSRVLELVRQMKASRQRESTCGLVSRAEPGRACRRREATPGSAARSPRRRAGAGERRAPGHVRRPGRRGARRARALHRQPAAAAPGHRRSRPLRADVDRRALRRSPRRAGLLRRFMREFKPEQVKRYLAREVIAGLPNAAAIDLAQFAGLDEAARLALPMRASTTTCSPRCGRGSPQPAAFRVEIVGRWSEVDARPDAAARPPRRHAEHAIGRPALRVRARRCRRRADASCCRRWCRGVAT